MHYLILVLGAVGSLDETVQEWMPSQLLDMRCGVYCAYVAVKSLGGKVPGFQEFEKVLGQPSSGGYSMLQIERLATGTGLHGRSVITTLENVERLETPARCVALFRTGHFVLPIKWDEKTVRVIDPPEEYEMQRILFDQLWQGEAVIFSTKELDESWNWTIPGTALRRSWLPWVVAVSGIAAACALFWRLRRAGRFGNRPTGV